MIIDKQLIETLLHLPKRTIIALINVLTKKVYLAYTSDSKSFLARILCELEASTFKYQEDFPLDSISVHILDPWIDELDARLYLEYNKDIYHSLGYTIVNTFTYVKIRPKIVIGNDYIYVCLVTAKYNKTIVGVFKSKPEAKEFIETYYNAITNQYCYPVYANNRITSKYLESHKKQEQILK